MKKLLIFNLLLTTLFISGCSDTETPSKNQSNLISIDSTNEDTSIYTPFILTGNSITPSPFSILNESLIFPNWEENNKISFIKIPTSNSILKSSDITKQLDNYTSSLVLLNDNIYFGDSSKNNSLSLITPSSKEVIQLNSNSVHMLSALDESLYYINIQDQKLYSYNTSTKNGGAISLDRVGKYIINNNFIIYQNLSDNNKLYKIKLDGSSREVLSSFAVDSFAVYKNQLIVSNSEDNNYIYHINPMTLDSKRLLLTSSHDIKSINDRVFFINNLKGNTLCELSLDLEKNSASFKIFNNNFTTEYYPSSKGIFIREGSNTNSIHYISLE
ncbi:MAG: DUF5050 domain-containing protein [Clostridium sp.]